MRMRITDIIPETVEEIEPQCPNWVLSQCDETTRGMIPRVNFDLTIAVSGSNESPYHILHNVHEFNAIKAEITEKMGHEGPNYPPNSWTKHTCVCVCVNGLC